MQIDCMNNSKAAHSLSAQGAQHSCEAAPALLSSGLSQGHLLSVQPFLSAGRNPRADTEFSA